MGGKRVVPSARTRQDIRHITAWYRQQGGAGLALRWNDAIKSALQHIGAHPKTGFTHYASELRLEGLRCWPVHGFPYLLFYREQEAQVEVARVLHAQRDIPAWMGSAP